MSTLNRDILRSAIVTKEEQKLFQHRARDFQIWNQDFTRQQQQMQLQKDAEAKPQPLQQPELQLPTVMQRLNPEAEDFQPAVAAPASTAVDEESAENSEERTADAEEITEVVERHGMVSNHFGAFLLPLARGLTLLDVCRAEVRCSGCLLPPPTPQSLPPQPPQLVLPVSSMPPTVNVLDVTREKSAKTKGKKKRLEEQSREAAVNDARPPFTPGAPVRSSSSAGTQTQAEDCSGGAAGGGGSGYKAKSAKIYPTKSPRFLQQLNRQGAAQPPLAVVRPQQPSAARPASPYGYPVPGPMPMQFPPHLHQMAFSFPMACMQFVGPQPHPATVLAQPGSRCQLQPAGYLLAAASALPPPWLQASPNPQPSPPRFARSASPLQGQI